MLKALQSSYYLKLQNPLGLAVLDTTDYYGEGRYITRINVPRAHRGQGHAHALLAQLLADADDTSTTLFLEVASSDGLTSDQLETWYMRHGFKRIGGGCMFRRKPQPRS